jgi:hypothetical protein
MPKASILQSSFNAGEVSPLLYGQAPLPKYKHGLETCLNYIPTLQGPLVRRPGTKYAAPVKDSDHPPALIPFQFSVTQAYMLEFGANYIRFFANLGQVITSSTIYKFDQGFFQQQDAPNFGNFYATRASGTYGTGESNYPFVVPTVAAGSILELASPYAAADVASIKYAQNADTLYLFHPKYPIHKLQRFGQQYWQLKQVVLQDGPYNSINSFKARGDSTEVTLYTGTNFAASPQFYAGPLLNISSVVTDPGLSGQIQITTSVAHKYVSGQKVFLAAIGGTTEANNNDTFASFPANPNYWVITVTSPTTFLLNASTFTHAYTSGGTVQPALWASDMDPATFNQSRGRALQVTFAGQRYFCVMSSVVNAARMIVYIGPLAISTYVPPDSTTMVAWAMGTYSAVNGYPSCGTFHQDRLVLAGAPGSPQQIDASVPGDYENFAPSDRTTQVVSDANAYSFQLNSKDVNTIRWVTSSAQGILAGTYSGEWSVSAATPNEAITATNVNAAQTGSFGSADVDAVQLGNSALYVQRAGRKLRELSYFFQVGTFRSTDLTALSEHITIPSVTKLATQKETQPLVWAVRSDGILLSMIFDRGDSNLEAGWTRHQLGGRSDTSGKYPLVTSIGTIPSPDLSFDQVWLVVRRWLNGAFVSTVEYMTRIFDDSVAQADTLQMDCAGTYDVPITISGVTNATQALVTTALAHGLTSGALVSFSNVVGLSQITTDLNGNTQTSNLVNGKTFIAQVLGPTTFLLQDVNGNPVNSTAYSPAIGGGFVRKMVTSISGLTWLENETVSVLADGGIHPNVTVSNTGTITLQYPAAKVQIGFRYNSDGKLLRAEAGAADGTSIGKTRRTTRAAFMVHNIGDLSFGTSFKNLIPVNFERADLQLADNAVSLYSGIIRDGVESRSDFESQVCFRQSSPLPGTIQAITTFMEEQDV